jgi:phage-related protein
LSRNGTLTDAGSNLINMLRERQSDILLDSRLKGRDGISRALYVTAVGRRVVVVRAFIKKTQKTPNREIELALKRAKEISQ